MARTVEKLTPAKIKSLKEPGLYGDGAGLYLNVGPAGNKSWIFRFMLDGRARAMGLGPLNAIGLGDARQLAADCRRQRALGVDPLAARDAQREARKQEVASRITFKACAEKYIAANKAGWRNEKHGDQWKNTLEAYAYPTIGALAVGAIETGHVTKILEPIWSEKAETASRVRGRIEAILDYAATHRWRTGENPARWRGHLENVLPKRSKVAKVEHHAALPWQQIAPFMTELCAEGGISALALRLAILTATRTGEVIGAQWDEIDTEAALWTIPASRMKAGKELRVPLSEDALGVLREVGKSRIDGNPFVFPGAKKNSGLSNMALLQVLRRMKRADLTAHGFRSTFRDWAAETGRPADIAEAALAHVVGDKTVAAYQRADLLDRRRRLMDDWAAFCGGRSSVTPMRKGSAA